MKTLIRFSTLSLCAFMLVFTACRKKDDIKDTAENIQSSEDNSMAESEFSNANDAAEGEARATGGVKKTNGIRRILFVLPQDSAKTSVTVTDSTTYKKVVLDYGTTPVACNDGKYRKGQIIFRVDTAFYKTAGKKASLTLQNYFAGFDQNALNQHTGKKELTNNGLNTANQPYFTLNVTGASVITTNGTISWTSTRTITKTAGYTTPLNPWDDEYDVTGSASGTNRNGEAFTVNITTTLHKKIQLGCASTFVTGVWQLTNTSSNKTMVLNYDAYNNGACDKAAKVTINSKDYIVVVK